MKRLPCPQAPAHGLRRPGTGSGVAIEKSCNTSRHLRNQIAPHPLNGAACHDVQSS